MTARLRRPSVLWTFVITLLFFNGWLLLRFVTAPTEILIWHGDEQSFGTLGTPQRDVNILGTVRDAGGIARLSFSLNGGPVQPLTVGPDTRRLAGAGDFNVAIPVTALNPGPNQIAITAVDTLGSVSSATVTVRYQPDTVWPLPYAVDWSTVAAVQEAAQVVDGPWRLTPDGVRPATIAYDRVLAIGDRGWTDYEVTVPVTLHDFDPTPRDGAGFGIWLRWNEHTDVPVICPQPACGWLPNGSAGWYTLQTGGTLTVGDVLLEGVSLPAGETFIWKLQVATVDGDSARYALKVWPAGEPEPAGWLGSARIDDNRRAGSLLLVAHNADVTFGNLTVTPLSSDVPEARPQTAEETP